MAEYSGKQRVENSKEKIIEYIALFTLEDISQLSEFFEGENYKLAIANKIHVGDKPKEKYKDSAVISAYRQQIQNEISKDTPNEDCIVEDIIKIAEEMYKGVDIKNTVTAQIAKRRVEMMKNCDKFTPEYFNDLISHITLDSQGRITLHTKTETTITEGMLMKLVMDAMEDCIAENMQEAEKDKKVLGRVNKVATKAKELAEDMHRKVTVQELSEETGISRKAIEDAMRISGYTIEDLERQS